MYKNIIMSLRELMTILLSGRSFVSRLILDTWIGVPVILKSLGAVLLFA